MTKLWIFSDLHIEQSDWNLPANSPEFDIMVAAGDIHETPARAIEWLTARALGKPIVYVAGNHEWYSSSGRRDVKTETKRGLLAAQRCGANFLMNSEVEIGGVRFLGVTLWTDYDLVGDSGRAMSDAERWMNDHRVIYPDKGSAPLRALMARDWHWASRVWLEARLSKPSDAPTVVVTHHLPHPNSIAAEFIGDPLNPAFCSDLSELIETSGASLWVHGHTHASCDYKVGFTRIVCNPKGYGPRNGQNDHLNPAFDPALVIEVSQHSEDQRSAP